MLNNKLKLIKRKILILTIYLTKILTSKRYIHYSLFAFLLMSNICFAEQKNNQSNIDISKQENEQEYKRFIQKIPQHDKFIRSTLDADIKNAFDKTNPGYRLFYSCQANFTQSYHNEYLLLAIDPKNQKGIYLLYKYSHKEKKQIIYNSSIFADINLFPYTKKSEKSGYFWGEPKLDCGNAKQTQQDWDVYHKDPMFIWFKKPPFTTGHICVQFGVSKGSNLWFTCYYYNQKTKDFDPLYGIY